MSINFVCSYVLESLVASVTVGFSRCYDVIEVCKDNNEV